jgi:hypothetical protein
MDKHFYLVDQYHAGNQAIFRVCYDHIIATTLKQNKVWEPYLHRLFEKYISKTSVVLEGGCHIGAHTVKLAKLGFHLHALESNLLNLSILRENIILNELPNVTLYQNELSIQVAYREPAPYLSIDYMNLENVDFIKLDVGETILSVLEGGMETIQQCLPVILIKNHPPFPAMDLSLLLNIGYHIEKVEGGEPDVYSLYVPPIEEDYIDVTIS